MVYFLPWYLGKLKSHPVMTNLGSAVVIMTVGDVMAQELERHKLGDAVTGTNEDLEGVPERRLLHMREYNKFLHHHDDNSHNHPSNEQAVSIEEPEEQSPPPQQRGSHKLITYEEENSTRDWRLLLRNVSETMRHEYDCWDGFRTSTMAFWSVGFYAPAWMYLFRIYNRFLPNKTPAVIAFQVVFNVLYSIPINAMFFAYGSFVHHTTEWLDKREEVHDNEQEAASRGEGFQNTVLRSPLADPPYDWDMMLSTAELKMQAELYNAVVASAKMWIPFNALSFTMIPPHCQPLALMGFSVFWNCYLSLVQHRDVPLPEEKLA